MSDRSLVHHFTGVEVPPEGERLCAGDRVLAFIARRGEWLPATYNRMNDAGMLSIETDDGDRAYVAPDEVEALP